MPQKSTFRFGAITSGTVFPMACCSCSFVGFHGLVIDREAISQRVWDNGRTHSWQEAGGRRQEAGARKQAAGSDGRKQTRKQTLFLATAYSLLPTAVCLRPPASVDLEVDLLRSTFLNDSIHPGYVKHIKTRRQRIKRDLGGIRQPIQI